MDSICPRLLSGATDNRAGAISIPAQQPKFLVTASRAEATVAVTEDVSIESRRRLFMNKYVVEFIGTFFLVLTIGCTVISHGAGPFAPLAIGSALMVMIFAGGDIAGGHFNPAVRLGVWLRGKCEAKDVAPYMIFQIMGAVLAASVVTFLKAGAAVTPL